MSVAPSSSSTSSTSSSAIPAPPVRTWTSRCLHALGQLFVVAATAGGLIVGGWWFVNLQVDRRLAQEVERKLTERLGASSDVVVKVGSARRIEGRGIELRRVAIGPKSGTPWAEIDELWLACNAELQDLLNGRLHVRHVEVRHARWRAVIDQNGRWSWPNLQLRDSPSGGEPTTIALEDGQLEVVDRRHPHAKPFVLRGIELDVKRPTRETLETFDWTPALPWHVRGRCAADRLEQGDFEALFDGATGELLVRGVLRDLAIAPELVETLPREAGELLAPVSAVRGRVRGEFQIDGRARGGPANGGTQVASASSGEAADRLDDASNSAAGRGTSWKFRVSGELGDGRVDDPRLDSPLTGLRAKFRFDERGFAIEEATAQAGESTIYGWLKCDGYSADSPLSLEIRARKYRVGSELIELAPPNWQEALRNFQVEGVVNADVRATYDGRDWRPDVTVQCVDVAFEYAQFPYRLTDGAGYLEFKDRSLRSTRLQALAEGSPVRLDVRLENLGPDYTGSIEFSTDSPVTVDERLLGALDDRVERIVRTMHARGDVTVHARFERSAPDAPPKYAVRVGVHQGAVQYVHFPYPLERIRGTLVVTDAGWQIEELAGENNTAYVECRGGWTPRAGGGDLRLDFLATDLPLDDELQQALPPSGQRAWSQLRPRGTLDNVVVGVRLPAGATAPEIEATAEKRPARQNVDGRTLSVRPVAFPYQVDNLTGSVRYRAGEFVIEQLRGEHGRTVLQSSGACVVRPDGVWRLDLGGVSIDRLHVDHDLIAALPPELGRSLARLQISGPLRGQGRVSCEGSTQFPDQLRGGWDLSVDVENGGLQCGLPIEQIRGDVRFIGQYGPQGFSTRGELAIDSLFCRGIQITGVRGPIWISGGQIVFGDAWTPPAGRSPTPRPVTAQAFGGAIVADASVALGDDVGFRVEALMNDADLAMLAREAAARRRDIVGKASAAVRLEGSSRGSHTLRGNGWLKCRDADIDELPVTGAMLKQIGDRKNGQQRALSLSDVDFRIQDNIVYFPRIDLKGEGLTLRGNGEMQFNRTVDLTFYTVVGRDELRLPVLAPVLAEASRQMLEIEVTGTLDEPEVKRHVVPVINDTLQQMFPELGERPAAERPLLRRLAPTRQPASAASAPPR